MSGMPSNAYVAIAVERDRLLAERDRLKAQRDGLLVALDALYKDGHHWSKRPCSTCAAITKAAGVPFGCDRFAGRAAIAAAEDSAAVNPSEKSAR